MTAQVWHPMPWGRPPQQLCTGTNPFTFFDIARGFKSCTMNSHGASSTILACAAASSFVCSAVSKLACACFSSAVTSALSQCPQL
jgi:TctA family transporter